MLPSCGAVGRCAALVLDVPSPWLLLAKRALVLGATKPALLLGASDFPQTQLYPG